MALKSALSNLGWVIALVLVLTGTHSASGTETIGIPTARTFYDTSSPNFVIDFVSDPVIDQLWRAGRLFEDNIFNKVPVKFVYSSKTNRTYSQAGVSYQEDDDPVDSSSTRTPPRGSDGRYLSNGLRPWTLISQFGARSWGEGGARHYGAAVQFNAFEMDDGTVSMCLSTAPGVESETRYSGRNDHGQHLVCQVLIMPNGDTVFGYNTDPNYTPKIMFQGQPYFYATAPPKYFIGDAWTYLVPPAKELEGRRAMRERMFQKVE